MRKLLVFAATLSALSLTACGGDDAGPPPVSERAKETVSSIKAACPDGARSYAPVATTDGTRYNDSDSLIVVCEDDSLKTVTMDDEAERSTLEYLATQAIEACDTRKGVYAIAGLATVEGTRYNKTDALVVTCGDKSLHALQISS